MHKKTSVICTKIAKEKEVTGEGAGGGVTAIELHNAIGGFFIRFFLARPNQRVQVTTNILGINLKRWRYTVALQNVPMRLTRENRSKKF